MEEVVWSVEERFTFPAVGLVREAEVDVTPQWQVEHSALSVRLVGIYHMAATVTFEPSIVHVQDEEMVVIDDVDVDGTTGYFEYAVPFSVDLPEHVGVPRLALNEVRTNVDDGYLSVKWDVCCRYTISEPVTTVQQEQQTLEPDEAFVEEELQQQAPSITSPPLIWDLVDHYTVVEIKLDQIVRQ